MSQHWKARLYDTYISNGQAGVGIDPSKYEGDPSRLFPPGNVAKFVARRIPKDRDIRILDRGCGHGAILHHLTGLGYRNLSGVDTSAEQIAIAHQTGMPFAVHGDIQSHLAGLPDASVEVALLIDVIEHMEPEDLFGVLDAFSRVLKPGGLCIVHVPNGAGINGMDVRYLLRWLEVGLGTTVSSSLALWGVGLRASDRIIVRDIVTAVKSRGRIGTERSDGFPK